eukprot:1407970-Rhodomonas_salina.1
MPCPGTVGKSRAIRLRAPYAAKSDASSTVCVLERQIVGFDFAVSAMSGTDIEALKVGPVLTYK